MRIVASALLVLFACPVSLGGIKLKSVRFPSALGGTGGATTPPGEAPLGQGVVFEFDGKPKIGSAVGDALRIRIAETNTLGQAVGRPAFGTYEVSGHKVVFTPRLPTSALPTHFGPLSDNAGDASLPGLLPATTYRIDVKLDVDDAVKNLSKVSHKLTLPIPFTTVDVSAGSGAISIYFANATDKPPKLKKNKIKPKPGLDALHPNTFDDPSGLFAGIPAGHRPPFRLVFDSPLDPSADNIGSPVISLRSLKTAEGLPVDIDLPVDVVLTDNRVDRSEIHLFPRGILPLGHTVAIFVADTLRGISGATKNDTGVTEDKKVAKYKVSLDPAPGAPIVDRVVEEFDTDALQDTAIAALGKPLASWDVNGSGALQAAVGFGGDGALGRFEPPDNGIVITLDTDFQAFPLLSGATPDAMPGTHVKGGVFSFTDFSLPASATLRLRGSNPAVIACAGEVRIEGTIDLNGQDGVFDVTANAAIVPTPGGSAGAGGGRGGDGHPIKALAGVPFEFTQTPQFGESGHGPGDVPLGGAAGGQSGCSLPWTGFSGAYCGDYGSTGDGSRGAGGGGGSFHPFFPDPTGPQDPLVAISGRRGGVGIGNHLPVLFDADEDPVPFPPEPEAYEATPGNPTNALARQNPNPTFDQAYKDGLIWDIGTMDVDASSWAKTRRVTFGGQAGPLPFSDADPDNDFIGPGGELATLIGGQGGGGGGSRTEGITLVCKDIIFHQGLPFTVHDAKGGGGGGAGGALLLQAVGPITFSGPSARIEARGGEGGFGEWFSNRGGSGGGGSGGCVILQSSTDVIMNDKALPYAVIDVSAGCGDDAATLSPSPDLGLPGGDTGVIQVGDGSPGGPGLVQVHVPDDRNIDKARIRADYFPSAFNIKCTGTNNGMALFNPLVPTHKTPVPESTRSYARSVWIDTGLGSSLGRPPVVTPAGALDGPIFGVPGVGPFFKGTDPQTGLVLTDDDGFVIDPLDNDIEVDSPGLLIDDYIPTSGGFFQSVRVQFQGADEDPANPGSPDLSTTTPFVADATQLNGRRFLRWELEFDIATDPAFPAGPSTPRPRVNWLRIPFWY